MRLVRILCDIAEVQAECLTKPAEFHLTLVLQAETEGLLSDLLQNNVFSYRLTFLDLYIYTW